MRRRNKDAWTLIRRFYDFAEVAAVLLTLSEHMSMRTAVARMVRMLRRR